MSDNLLGLKPPPILRKRSKKHQNVGLDSFDVSKSHGDYKSGDVPANLDLVSGIQPASNSAEGASRWEERPSAAAIQSPKINLLLKRDKLPCATPTLKTPDFSAIHSEGLAMIAEERSSATTSGASSEGVCAQSSCLTPREDDPSYTYPEALMSAESPACVSSYFSENAEPIHLQRITSLTKAPSTTSEPSKEPPRIKNPAHGQFTKHPLLENKITRPQRARNHNRLLPVKFSEPPGLKRNLPDLMVLRSDLRLSPELFMLKGVFSLLSTALCDVT
ncbi:hypothetical protein BDQ17DRAFT_1550053 [Cyathus striatus]|nr:hypothetical protein BDQ17DRAFT_1550053 [Cyathus striatus]